MSGDRLREALRMQAEACAALGSPFMARLLELLAARLTPGTPLTDRMFGWPGDVTYNGDSVALRLTGALHALRLHERAGLAAVYPPNAASDDALWAAVEAALETEAAFVDAFLDSPPQTNEVRRSAVLIALGHWLSERYALPLVLSEIGASAGLNLMWDRFALRAGANVLGPDKPALTLRPSWRGATPTRAAPVIAERRGVDINPLSPREDGLRLQAYLWPDQPERLALTRAALRVAEAPVDRADAVDWLSRRAAPRPGRLHLIYSTVAWQYLRAAERQRGREIIAAAGARASADAPLAWFRMETDGGTAGAALTLRLWPGDETMEIGRADFHGRWVDWRAGGG